MTTLNADTGIQLSDEQVTSYRQDGVILIKGLLDTEWVERIRIAIDQVLESVASGAETRKMVHVWRDDETFWQLSAQSAAPRLAGEATGAAEIRLLFDHLLVKEPNTAQSATLWHHDLPYWPIRGECICTLWIPLDSVTMANGAVEYARGSHLDPQLYRPALPPASLWGQAADLPPVPDIEGHRAEYDIIHFDTAPGDCLLHHSRILHGSPPNKSANNRRRAIAIRYVGEDTRFVGGGAGAPIMGDQRIGSPLNNAEHPVVWRRDRPATRKEVRA